MVWTEYRNSSRYSKVVSNFTEISSALSSKTTTFNCACAPEHATAYAYVYPNRPYEIYLCNAFWPAPVTGTESQAGTIIHEMSHFYVVAGTADNAYGQSAARRLAINNPYAAVANADSHEYFAENTPPLT